MFLPNYHFNTSNLNDLKIKQIQHLKSERFKDQIDTTIKSERFKDQIDTTIKSERFKDQIDTTPQI